MIDSYYNLDIGSLITVRELHLRIHVFEKDNAEVVVRSLIWVPLFSSLSLSAISRYISHNFCSH
jgi:hypothetical protein